MEWDEEDTWLRRIATIGLRAAGVLRESRGAGRQPVPRRMQAAAIQPISRKAGLETHYQVDPGPACPAPVTFGRAVVAIIRGITIGLGRVRLKDFGPRGSSSKFAMRGTPPSASRASPHRVAGAS